MRQPIKAVILGLLMTIFCLLIGGMGCREYPDPHYLDYKTPERDKWVCTLVVGTDYSATQVFFCHDPITDTCFWVPGRQGGAPVKTQCARHIFEEVRL